jgi:hypothetical protein
MQKFTRAIIFIALILAGFIFLQRQVIYDGISYRGEGLAKEKDALLKKYLDPPKHSDIFYNIVFWNFENEHLDYQLYTLLKLNEINPELVNTGKAFETLLAANRQEYYIEPYTYNLYRQLVKSFLKSGKQFEEEQLIEIFKENITSSLLNQTVFNYNELAGFSGIPKIYFNSKIKTEDKIIDSEAFSRSCEFYTTKHKDKKGYFNIYKNFYWRDHLKFNDNDKELLDSCLHWRSQPEFIELIFDSYRKDLQSLPTKTILDHLKNPYIVRKLYKEDLLIDVYEHLIKNKSTDADSIIESIEFPNDLDKEFPEFPEFLKYIFNWHKIGYYNISKSAFSTLAFYNSLEAEKLISYLRAKNDLTTFEKDLMLIFLEKNQVLPTTLDIDKIYQGKNKMSEDCGGFHFYRDSHSQAVKEYEDIARHKYFNDRNCVYHKNESNPEMPPCALENRNKENLKAERDMWKKFIAKWPFFPGVDDAYFRLAYINKELHNESAALETIKDYKKKVQDLPDNYAGEAITQLERVIQKGDR